MMKNLFQITFLLFSISLMGNAFGQTPKWSQNGRAFSTYEFKGVEFPFQRTGINNDGSKIIFGLPYKDIDSNSVGAVFIYELINDEWIQLGDSIKGAHSYERLGFYVSMNYSGNTIIASGNTESFSGNTGIVKVYEYYGANWIQKGEDILDSNEGDFGSFIDIDSSGNNIIIGAPKNDDEFLSSGQVKVYNWNGSSWQQKGININGSSISAQIGRAVSISSNGNTIAVGSNLNNGMVQIFDWSNSQWEQRGNFIGGFSQSSLDEFGSRLDLSSNGDKIVISAIFEDSGPSSKGVSRVYEWDGTMWSQVGNNILGNNGSWHGNSISLDKTGNRLLLSSPSSNVGYDSYCVIMDYNENVNE